MQKQVTACDGCGAPLTHLKRWCPRCKHVAADIKALESITAKYQLPPETRLDQAAAGIRQQLREGTGNARELADDRARQRAQREDRKKRRSWWELLKDLRPGEQPQHG